jgi:putative transposase
MGRFKAIAVQCDAHFLRLCRYVERNPIRVRLVEGAEDWEWSSASRQSTAPWRPCLEPWPVAKPVDWLDELNGPERGRELDLIRTASDQQMCNRIETRPENRSDP